MFGRYGDMTTNYKVSEYHRKEDIFEHIHLGTNLPVLGSFKKYFFHEVELMGCFSLLITEEDTNQIIGHTLLYQWEKTLYFAFFYGKDALYENTRIVVDRLTYPLISLDSVFPKRVVRKQPLQQHLIQILIIYFTFKS